MAQVLNSNWMSSVAQRVLYEADRRMQASLTKLSSGLRINSAKDDSAGLAVATRFSAQINGLNQAIRNANDGTSLVQTAGNALGEITNSLQRIRETLVRAGNSSYGDPDREAMNEEITSLKDEISRVTDTVDFNGIKVLGSAASLDFQIGNEGDTTIHVVTVELFDVAGTASGIGSALTSDVTASSVSAAISSLVLVDSALLRLDQIRAKFGNTEGRFESVINSLQNIAENMSASRSRILDADYASTTAGYTKAQVLQSAGMAMLAQANAAPQVTLSLLG